MRGEPGNPGPPRTCPLTPSPYPYRGPAARSLGRAARSPGSLHPHPAQANLSLRQLADMTSLSSPYLSEVERGLHEPSVRAVKLISGALSVSLKRCSPGGTARCGGCRRRRRARQRVALPDVEAAIRADQQLSEDQKSALTAVRQSMLRPASVLPAGYARWNVLASRDSTARPCVIMVLPGGACS
jgi:transcriptional regulator with XRE-family HTH domain